MLWSDGDSDASAGSDGDVTVVRVLQQSGYRTALFGKWGPGDVGAAESGLPRKHRFDEFFGYLSQHYAHNHFPDFLWRNEEKVALPNKVTPVGEAGGGYATEAVQFADDLFAAEAHRFVDENKSQPFFLYWSIVTPHANNERTKALAAASPAGDVVKDFHAVNYCDSATKWPQHVAVGETHGRAEPD